MPVLSYKIANCKNCYKCLRECPVKAISMLNEQALIVDELCILCGKCTNVCPQKAKFVVDTTDDVKELLANNKKIIVSLAPSYIANFPIKHFKALSDALKLLGFFDVEETAVGAKYINQVYERILNIDKFPVFITSCCPTVNSLIEKHYPEALPFLAPVDTPMVAHGKMIKQKHPDAKVVFIGPCIAKKDEAIKSGVIDGVLTFTELNNWLSEKSIDLETLDNKVADEKLAKNNARYYPIERGIIKSIEKTDTNYDYLSVSGLDKCIDVLKHITELHGLFIEMNACEYGCVNGPCAQPIHGGAIKATEVIRKFTKSANGEVLSLEDVKIKTDAAFKNCDVQLKIPDEIEMKAILSTYGKYKPSDELNCGACGYPTCRAKAIAIYNHMAEKEMCLPFMKEQAESLSNQVIKYSPNGIVLTDDNNYILECNDRAKEILGLTINPVRRLIGDISEMDVLVESMISKQINHKCHLLKNNRDILVSTVFVEKQKIYITIIIDVTEDEANRRKILELRQSTLDITNKVIEKQMRAAQEIASLLGETTAETKIAIYDLRKALVTDDEGK